MTEYKEARSLLLKEIYDFYVTGVGLKQGFYYFDDEHDIWDNLRIHGKTLEEVLERSYIVALN